MLAMAWSALGSLFSAPSPSVTGSISSTFSSVFSSLVLAALHVDADVLNILVLTILHFDLTVFDFGAGVTLLVSASVTFSPVSRAMGCLAVPSISSPSSRTIWPSVDASPS